MKNLQQEIDKLQKERDLLLKWVINEIYLRDFMSYEEATNYVLSGLKRVINYED